MTLPTIHLNGTSPEMLRRGYEDARLAVSAAMQALSRIEFNARDYYVQGPAAWRVADDEMQARYVALEKVGDELARIENHVKDAIDAWEAQKR